MLEEFRVLREYESHFGGEKVKEGGEVRVELVDKGLMMGESLG